MKKIFSFAIVLAAAAMISCGGNANKPAAEAEAEANVECTKCEKTDSCCCCEKTDSTATEAAEATEAPAEATK